MMKLPKMQPSETFNDTWFIDTVHIKLQDSI